METVLKASIKNFVIEVATDKALDIPQNSQIREIVVPSTYQTTSNALFKARALQYCLEKHVNMLHDEDWIVHLDEETLLTENSLVGVLNFCIEGKHELGQGVITYCKAANIR